jgi:hypothetical protein
MENRLILISSVLKEQSGKIKSLDSEYYEENVLNQLFPRESPLCEMLCPSAWLDWFW